MSQKITSWLLPIAAFLALVVILWLPFTLKVTGIMEEWIALHDLEKAQLTGHTDEYSLFMTAGDQRLRPLGELPIIVAYTLTPDSFVGFNLVMMALFFAKGLTLYLILRRLVPGNRLFALLVGLLLVIFPADSGLFTFRAINIQAAVVEFLVAVYLFLIYARSGRRLALVGAWVASIYGLLTYEIAYPLIFLTPILLVWQEGRLTRDIIRKSLLWYLAPLVALLYVAVTFVQGASYQSWLLQHSGLNQSSVGGAMLTSLFNAYYRHFLEGWAQGLQQLATPYLGLALVALVGALLAGWLLTRQGAALDNHKRRYWILALIGFAVVGIGYAPYLVTPYRELDWRVYYYSSIGGALCVGSLAYLLVLYGRLRPLAFAVIMSILIGIGTLRALNQHQYYAQLADNEQQLLHGIVGQVPQLDPKATLVVVDETGRYNSNWSMGATWILADALSYIYDQYDVKAVLCAYNPARAAFVALPELQEKCQFAGDGITLRQGDQTMSVDRYDQVVVVRYAESGAQLLDRIPDAYLPNAAAVGYNPSQLVNLAASPPRRFNTLFWLSG